MKKLLNVKTVANLLDVPVATIRYWCFTRKLKFYKMGRHVRFDAQDIEKFVEDSLVEGGSNGRLQQER